MPPPLPDQAAWADPALGWPWPLERLPAEVGIPLWAPDRALMCGPSTPFSPLEPWVRPVQLGSSPWLFRYPGLTGSDSPAAFFGRRDSRLVLNRTVIMSTLLHPVPVAGADVRPAELRWECGPPRGHPAPALPVVRSFRETYPKPPKAMVHTSAPQLHTPGISRGK
jgi:hypothetical protein